MFRPAPNACRGRTRDEFIEELVAVNTGLRDELDELAKKVNGPKVIRWAIHTQVPSFLKAGGATARPRVTAHPMAVPLSFANELDPSGVTLSATKEIDYAELRRRYGYTEDRVEVNRELIDLGAELGPAIVSQVLIEEGSAAPLRRGR